MQFKHPEILYALLLLLIPILVHLFQLRRFKKTPFTNVHFLKEAVLQTRKSSQIKKWLTLLCRLLAYTFIILAFAQPFTTHQDRTDRPKETVIYIDNSFSMQAKGNRGELLQRVKQDLFENTQLPESFAWFTNNRQQPSTAVEQFKNDVLDINYSPTQYSPQEVVLQADGLFQETHTDKELIVISDFQHWEPFPEYNPETLTVKTIQVQPVNTNNVSIDSLSISDLTTNDATLEVTVSYQGSNPESLPVSLYNADDLIAKTSVSFDENAMQSVSFQAETNKLSNARLEIDDANLLFDNTLYFSLHTEQNINVLSINESNDTYLQRIFIDDAFSYTPQAVDAPDYSSIPEQHLVILNGLKSIPATLRSALQAFVENGGHILIIPGIEVDSPSYNSLLQTLNFGQLGEFNSQTQQLTTIHYDHPLYKNVFENEVQNFQYPSIKNSFTLNGSFSKILSFENGQPFLAQRGRVYVFSASHDDANSNFKGSPLIVPTIYNIGLKSLDLPQPYYLIGQHNRFDIAVSLEKDRILTMQQNDEQWIPMQQSYAQKVTITTDEIPEKSGMYTVKLEDDVLQNVAYNYSRNESELRYATINNWNTATQYNSINTLFKERAGIEAIADYWKWCILLALLFLVLEMLILKRIL